MQHEPARVRSVNVGRPQANPYKRSSITTGFGKEPTDQPVEVRAPGSKRDGLGSGLVGDHVGDRRHHGGDSQAVYAFAREDLDRWEARLDRRLPDGAFGDNLTTTGLDLAAARVGEVWQIGDTVQLRVTVARIPCGTFRGFLGIPGWLKTFTADERPGTYLAVATPGAIRSGDPIRVVHRPDHEVTVALVFRALTQDPALRHFPILRDVVLCGSLARDTRVERHVDRLWITSRAFPVALPESRDGALATPPRPGRTVHRCAGAGGGRVYVSLTRS